MGRGVDEETSEASETITATEYRHIGGKRCYQAYQHWHRNTTAHKSHKTNTLLDEMHQLCLYFLYQQFR
jgi:hypothetical protein